MAEKAEDKKSDGKKAPDGLKGPKVISIEDKKSKQKEVIQKLASEEPAQVAPEKSPLHQAGHSKISLNLSFELDKNLKMKLPFIIAILVFAGFAFVMFARTEFSFSDVFNFYRISENISKLTSISFILFFILYTLSLGLSVFFSFNLRSSNALLVSLFVAIPVIAATLIDPRYLLAYIFLGFGIMVTMLFGTLMENLDFGTISRTMSRALLVLLVVAVLFTVVKVYSAKDVYFDEFVTNVAKFSTPMQGQVQGLLADAIRDMELNESQLNNLVKSDPSTYITKNSVKALVTLQYPVFRDVSVNSFKDTDDKEYAKKTIPAEFKLLDISSQDKLTESTMASLKDPSTSDISKGSVKKMWPELRLNLADEVENKPSRQLTDEELAKVRQKLNTVEFMKEFYNFFEFFVAFIVFSLLSMANKAINLVSSAFCFGITKLL